MPVFLIITYLIVVMLFLPFAATATAPKSPLPGVKSDAIYVLEDDFHIPQLKRQRTVRIYLPPEYNPNHETGYPVLYMHDAQNLFSDETAFAGEWQVDETLNKLAKSHQFNLIVVGIDNGGENRIHELSAWDHPKYGKGEGKVFSQFIVESVKPFIDQHYNTNPAENAMMGSSLGALAAHYAIVRYPHIFNKAGLFSPSYWFTDQVFSFTRENPLPKDHRLFFTVGGKEATQMHAPLDNMIKLIQQSGHPAQHLYQETVAKGHHNEAFWRSRFGDAIIWLYQLEAQ